MIFKLNVKPYFPNKSYNLKPTLMFLEDWKLIVISGKDDKKFLQSQITYNLNDLKHNMFGFSAHCNEKGKVISNICIFMHNGNISYIQRSSVCEKQINFLKKYAIFSNVDINIDNKNILLGVAGKNSKNLLQKFFKNIPDINQTVVKNNNNTIIYYKHPQDRFILIIDKILSSNIINKLFNLFNINNSLQWLSLDIEAKYPIIDKENILKFTPQELNMDELGGISFNKGCYIGQEIISKIKYFNLNKNSIYCLYGTSNKLINLVDKLEIFINNKWCIHGKILAISQLKTNEFLIQAVLKRKLYGNKLRILNNKDSSFYIKK